MRLLAAVLIAGSALLSACDQQEMLEKFVPRDEAARAKRLLAQIAARDFAAVEPQLDANLQGPELRPKLEEMALQFPAGEPTTINTVGAHTSSASGTTTYNLTFEYAYPETWLLANVVIEHRDARATVLGVHVNPMKQSLKTLNRFTFETKGPLHYIIFGLAICIPLFVVSALVLCVRTPVPRRKWLWLLFITVGLVRFTLNWTDGTVNIQPVSFLLLGAGFSQAGPYAPLVFAVAIPVGAIVFLAMRRSFLGKSAG